MNRKRLIEVFSAGCPACQDFLKLVHREACDSCRVEVRDMNDRQVAERASRLHVRSVPAVFIDGKPAACCVGAGPDLESLRAAGLGQPLV